MIDLKFYSPTEQISHPLFIDKGVRVFLKRDDLIHPFISGNKWRKLKYLLLKAEKEGKNKLVTFGGAWSNHLLATACAAAKFGFKAVGIVRGEAVENEVLLLCKLFGMELQFVDREHYRDKRTLYNERFSADTSAFFIDEGGYSEEAVRGCSELADELDRDFGHVFCACGTGATAAGIIKGLSSRIPSCHFHGVPVLKNGEFLRVEINKLLIGDYPFSLHTTYHFGGYAKTKPELLKFIHNFSSRSGILLDPVYTGKMMYALFDLIEKDHFKQGAKIAAIHTGGLFGLLGMKEKFKEILPTA
ncbi:1-aminocyclopropane-1-carboxylate deaminase/D-cysteine desulfhydrase [Rubrolithibacter danxiaensis]|uniref:1-aminocyclopropane-1-carboxylate deaminase/D-cysteine desulfhydrase n=1 Tax=Rubrolithibacter danxiaensis TaxID=3390805 RepID=UPI003BF78318